MGLTHLVLPAVGYVLLLSCFVGSQDGAPSFAMAATPAEIDALLDLRWGFNDPPALADWGKDKGMRHRPPWFAPAPECTWTGITCDNHSLSVVRIDLPNCFQGGSIRPSIGSFPFLEILDLSGNALSGSIPSEITALEGLVRLYLHNNSLSGELPADWGNLKHLKELHLWKNKLNGSIPGGLFKAGELQKLRLENNNLSEEIPVEIVGHRRLRYFAVMSNQLTGQIPLQVGNVTSLRSVYAGFNKLNGTLPESIGLLRKLARLDLQHNQLHGTIPASWSNLTRVLLTLNLSGNVLSGEVPAGLLQKFNETSFMNNPDLCGAALDRMCPPPPSPSSSTPTQPHDKTLPPVSKPRERSHDGKVKAIAGVIGGSLGAVAVFALFLVVFLYRKSQTQRRDGSQVQNWFNPDIQADRRRGKFDFYDEGLSKYVFQDIESHAGFFDTAHVIGKGRFATVYRSHFPDGTELAVKVFKYPIVTATFDREITMLASIKHKHLLPIKGYYSTSIEKALVYDYFPSGTLYRLLHGEDASSPSVHGKGVDPTTLPDWAIRQKIAFGVAQALDYLHRGWNMRVVHMDVKSTNILLETSSLLPRLADFGIVHLISNKPVDSNDVVVETEGYTAPEVLMSRKYSDKSDVYSFGVVLLEILTGKKAICWVEDKKLLLASWAEELHQEQRGREIMDPVALKTSPFPEYLDRALSLALLCVSENPNMRPSMAEAASVLEGLASNPSPLRSPDLQVVKPLLLGR